MSHRVGLTVAVLLLAGCSTGGIYSLTMATKATPGPVPGAGVCTPDKPCELTGTVTLERRTGNNSWAALSQGGGCAPLLLPESIYREWRRWDNKHVRVSGIALARVPPASPEIIQLQYRDRWLSPVICGESDLVLYVNEIVRVR